MSDQASGRPAAYQELIGALREAEVLGSVAGVLSWDQETGMPPAGGALRAEQIATLSGLAHERRTSSRIGDLLAQCEGDTELAADEAAQANLREIRRDYDRAVRIPNDLVRRTAEATSLSQEAWREARERDDFDAFAPWLSRVLELSRERAACLAEEGVSPYDALMDEYEPGARAEEVGRVFGALRAELAPLIAEIADRAVQPGGPVQVESIPVERQAALNRAVLERVGFDFRAGRLDVSTHPFCQGIGAGDTRLTTRYDVALYTDALSSSLHEGGHGLYEQGLPKAQHPGQPLSEAASLGIHESQSRLWENQVGRSREFWTWALPLVREHFGAAVEGVEAEQVYGMVNRVEPNLIRVDSDEATYNLHIMLRFDLERALLAGELPVGDLPGAWNERVREDLGLEVPDNRRGCLQDIHWSMGAIGYFPTYTLGNLYAAQFWAAALRDLPDLPQQVEHGEFTALREWLREQIHQHGRRFSAGELCRRVTGSALTPEPFLAYLRGKLGGLYELG